MPMESPSAPPARLGGWLVFAVLLVAALVLFATQAPGLPAALPLGLEAAR